MRTVKLHDNYEEVFDMAAGGEPLIVASAKRRDVVVISKAEFDRLERNYQNAEYIAKLDKALDDYEAGKGISVTLEELREMERHD
jgi:PHD/YefM family antitoxin component YafN of YafNO toxin-antitoxin module